MSTIMLTSGVITAADRAFDANETCAHCGVSVCAGVKWVFAPISEFTGNHIDLYLCVHHSNESNARLSGTAILKVEYSR